MEPQDIPTDEIRLSNAEREQVIAQLQQATDEGRLSLFEFEERAGEAYAAQFPSQLAPLTKDLPTDPAAMPVPVVEVDATPVQRARRWLVSIMSEQAMRGNWDPGERTIAVAIMGSQVIDLTDVEATSVTITAYAMMGGVDIIVPEGAQVDIGGFMLMGSSSNEAVRAGDSPMRVHVRAWGTMGTCKVRDLKRREIRKRKK